MSMTALRTRALATSLVILTMAAAPAIQAQVQFVPPSDLVGSVFTTNNNDGYFDGRGVVFTTTSNFNLTSVGLFQNLTNTTLNYTLSLAPGSTGQVNGGAVVRSGSTLANTAGLQWLDFAVSPFTLMAGTYYHLEFKFNGNSNQNFFYDQDGAQPYAQTGFAGIDGTQAGNTGNSVLPGIRLNGASTSVVPEPSTYALMAFGLAGVFGVARRRRNA